MTARHFLKVPSERLVNALRRAEVETIDDLCSLSEVGVLTIKNCGRMTLRECQRLLAMQGRALAPYVAGRTGGDELVAMRMRQRARAQNGAPRSPAPSEDADDRKVSAEEPVTLGRASDSSGNSPPTAPDSGAPRGGDSLDLAGRCIALADKLWPKEPHCFILEPPEAGDTARVRRRVDLGGREYQCDRAG